jgi:hypothetical protein
MSLMEGDNNYFSTISHGVIYSICSNLNKLLFHPYLHYQ